MKRFCFLLQTITKDDGFIKFNLILRWLCNKYSPVVVRLCSKFTGNIVFRIQIIEQYCEITKTNRIKTNIPVENTPHVSLKITTDSHTFSLAHPFSLSQFRPLYKFLINDSETLICGSTSKTWQTWRINFNLLAVYASKSDIIAAANSANSRVFKLVSVMLCT